MDRSRVKVFMMVGLSACGKSTVSDKLIEKYNCVKVSSDAIRGELCGGNCGDQSKNEAVFKLYHRRINEYIMAGRNVICDATNVRLKDRRGTIFSIKNFCNKYNIDVELIAYIIPKPVRECVKDDVGREFEVGKRVIYKQYYGFSVPFYEEGFDQIVIHDLGYEPRDNFLKSMEERMDGYDQKNPHHNEDLLSHCLSAYNMFIKEYDYPERYKVAAKYHDIGKYFTQTFDEEGIAHYYSHESVGAYYLLSNYKSIKAETGFSDDEILDMIFLVNYHMQAMNWKSEKSINKAKKNFGEEKFQLIMDFTRCDKSRTN